MRLISINPIFRDKRQHLIEQSDMKTLLMKSSIGIRNIKLLVFLMSLTALHSSIAQSSISGTVKDETGEGLPGATVMEKGTTNGITTDLDGRFILSSEADDFTILVSFVGYLPQEISVGSQTEIEIRLESDVKSLEEVVVVGYGTKKKETVTGSIVQVKGEDVIRGKATSNAAVALQGEAPGLIVTRTSARPGNEGLEIKIRGDFSINGNGPLVILDGIPVGENQLGTINPNDIENIAVLKDGAAAIYGSRAAGGVILVTTKKGKVGKPVFNYNAQFQMNRPVDLPIASLTEWAQLWLEAGNNDVIDYLAASDGVLTGETITNAPTHQFYSAEQFQQIIDGTWPLSPFASPLFGQDVRIADVSQADAVYGNTWSHRHNFSMSGGSEKVRFRTSFGYNDERSPIDVTYDGAVRYNFRTNLTYYMNDLLQTDFSISFDRRDIKEPRRGVGGGFQDPDIFALYNPQGQLYDEFGQRENNPIALLQEGGTSTVEDKILRLSGKATLDLNKYVEGLSFGYESSFIFFDRLANDHRTAITSYDWEGNPTTEALASTETDFTITDEVTQLHTISSDYRTTLGGKHNLAVSVIGQAQLTERFNNQFERSNLLSNDLNHISTGDVETTRIGNGASTGEGIVSLISRVNYDFDEIYLFEFLVRRDGSSRLHPDYRWQNFYGGSVGIRISEMSFMPEGIFDNLKLRLSYGEAGSTTGIGNTDYISDIATGNTLLGNEPFLTGNAHLSRITSINRTWERVATSNVALDFAVLRNRLAGTAEYFIRENSNMLIKEQWPTTIGPASDIPETNSAVLQSKGWELSVTWQDNIGDLKYNITAMAWDSRNETTKYNGTFEPGTPGLYDDPANGELLVGRPINFIMAYKTNGILETEEQVLEYYEQYGFENPEDLANMKAGTLIPSYTSGSRLTTGNVRRVDVNGDGTINQDDLIFIGDNAPHNNMGLRLGVEWKGLDFSAFFQGVLNQNLVRTGTMSYPFSRWWQSQNATFVGETWNEGNTNAELPKIFNNGIRKGWNYNLNDINVIQARYVRAKLITLGYTIPQRLTNRVGLDRVRASVTGNDLFVISNVKDGMDPEANANGGNGNVFPFTSNIIFGLDLTF